MVVVVSIDYLAPCPSRSWASFSNALPPARAPWLYPFPGRNSRPGRIQLRLPYVRTQPAPRLYDLEPVAKYQASRGTRKTALYLIENGREHIMMGMDQSSEIPQLLNAWCRERPVRLCVLFGSQATGLAHAGSDVDVAVWPAERPSTQARLAWLAELATRLDREVSLVMVSADLDPVLAMEIYRHGRLVYEREPELWFHHRLQLWHVYNDSLPFLRAARQQLRKFAEEVRRGA